LNAIILAAGKGERLRPLTNDLPKCLIKLFGKSLLEWQIDAYISCGITDITVVTGYKSELIKFPQINTIKNEKFAVTNMVETLFCAKEKLENSTIVSYGDIIFEPQILHKLISSKYDYSVVVDRKWLDYWKKRFPNPSDDAESLTINKDGFITNIGQKVNSIDKIEAQYIGLMKFQNDAISFIKNFYQKAKNQSSSGYNILNPNLNFENSYMTDLLNSLINTGCKLKAVEIENAWLELDSLHDYTLYEKMYNEGSLKNFFNTQ